MSMSTTRHGRAIAEYQIRMVFFFFFLTLGESDGGIGRKRKKKRGAGRRKKKDALSCLLGCYQFVVIATIRTNIFSDADVILYVPRIKSKVYYNFYNFFEGAPSTGHSLPVVVLPSNMIVRVKNILCYRSMIRKK